MEAGLSFNLQKNPRRFQKLALKDIFLIFHVSGLFVNFSTLPLLFFSSSSTFSIAGKAELKIKREYSEIAAIVNEYVVHCMKG